MSITQDMASVVTAANNLTQQVSSQINSINQRVTNFEAEARNIANQAVAQLNRAPTGFDGNAHRIYPTAEDETGALVQKALDDGHKHVMVEWNADGKERHWNTKVTMPIGATLFISGPISNKDWLGGNIRTDRACYANGQLNGTAEAGSPMIFRNLEPAFDPYPFNDHAKSWDYISLISCIGNNVVIFGNGTYLHDQGGMCATAEGSALISVEPYGYGTPTFVGSGGAHCQFYLSGPIVNNRGGTTTCEVRFMDADFKKVTSDGPALQADKGYRRLLNNGVSVPAALLNKQPYEYTDEEAALNDNIHAGFHKLWISYLRGIETETDRPRLISNHSWAYPGGWTYFQSHGGEGECSLAGLERIGTTDTWFASR